MWARTGEGGKVTDLLGALVSMTRDSKACLTGVAVEVEDV